MKFTVRLANTAALLVCLLALSVSPTLAQSSTRDALAGLKRAISQASAPALTTQQETDLNALITAYKDALPDGEDTTLATARDAYDAAVLAGNITAATTAATQIATRTAELASARLVAQAKFAIAVLANLKTGGQLTALTEKLGSDRLLSLVNSLAGGGGGFGGPGGGGGGRH